jgi:hypothetical protein
LAIQDLTAFTPTDDSQNSQLDGIAKFVEQFRNVEDRWLDIYSESAEQVVRCVSEYLNVLLNRDNPLKDDYEPLISALRCLVMSHNFKMFDTNYRPGWISKRGRDKSKKVFGRSEIELGRTGQLTLSPEIVLLRRPKDSPDDEHRKGESDSFCYQLAKAIESTEKMLLRGSPRDWPTVIFSCSILALVYNNLPEMEDYTRVFWPLRGGLYRAMQELSSLYLFCCGDMHPLNQKFDIHWFRLMVGGDSLAIQHYEAMNKQWLEFIEGRKAYSD